MNSYRVIYNFGNDDRMEQIVVASTPDNAWTAVQALYAAGTITPIETVLLRTGIIVGS